VGDSSVFLWRRGRFQRLSEVHTVDQADNRHVLTRALGLEAGVEPHFFEADLEDGDLILLCSDGVTGPLSETALAELLSRQASARTLVSRARAATDEKTELRDDASAVIVEVIERGPANDARRQRLEVIGVLHPGTVVDGHRLVRPLADTERIWVAESANGAQVVLKFPPRDAIDNEIARDAFVREAWNATRLVSPDLVRAWMSDQPVLRSYMMEFVDAPTLRAVLKAGHLSVDDARELAVFLLRVSQFLLRHDLAHGDIKPENILVLRSATGMAFRLLDLGSAAELFSVTSRAGTPSYLAPERFHGGAIAERTEIFAIGVTLYEALAGAYPYGEVERFQTPRFDAAPKRLTKLNSAVPPWLESVILRAIDPDPERRYQNFSEVDYDLGHPGQVAAHHRKGASLLERNPLLFYKIVCVVLALTNVWLLFILARR
jgi:serine/threonine protein kinase